MTPLSPPSPCSAPSTSAYVIAWALQRCSRGRRRVGGNGFCHLCLGLFLQQGVEGDKISVCKEQYKQAMRHSPAASGRKDMAVPGTFACTTLKGGPRTNDTSCTNLPALEVHHVSGFKIIPKLAHPQPPHHHHQPHRPHHPPPLN